jgi:hypothetical protein
MEPIVMAIRYQELYCDLGMYFGIVDEGVEEMYAR